MAVWKRVTKADKKVVERTAPTRARQQVAAGDSKNFGSRRTTKGTNDNEKYRGNVFLNVDEMTLTL
jgi:hypothetical protein